MTPLKHHLNQFGKATISTLLTCSLACSTFGATAVAADRDDSPTRTPVRHVVVIFQENVSFDHYFATYPNSANPQGEPKFVARPGTPSVNGLTQQLIDFNPNSEKPFRLDRSQAATCDQDHNYGDEQKAFDAGLMDKFPEFTGNGGCPRNQVMGYFDGNTVTAFWNYAQNFAMSDNSYNTTFGPSTPGALNLVSGQTHGASSGNTGALGGDVVGTTDGDLTVISDAQPKFDDCSSRETVSMGGRNVGNLLSDHGITWGWFQGGFRPSSVNAGKAVCATAHTGSDGNSKKDYIPHHEPFQYYASTSNPHHLPPTSVASIGRTDQANHQYDLADFWAAFDANNLPAVSFLKAPGYQDGHAGYSDPLAEQTFIVQTINRLQQSDEWKETAVIIAYDDSDGWYDHAMSPIVSKSNTVADSLSAPGQCGIAPAGSYQGRCGYGPRLPLLVISPYAKVNFVDGTVTDQSSILRFIEDNWNLGRIGNQSFDEKAGTLENMLDFTRGERARKLFLDPSTGQPSGTDR